MIKKLINLFKNSLTLKLLTPMVALSFIVLYSTVAIVHKQYKTSFNQILKTRKIEIEEYIKKEIEDEKSKLMNISKTLSHNPEIINIYKEDKRERFKLLSIIQILESDKNLKIHFHKYPGFSYFRSWVPDDYGEDLRKFRRSISILYERKRPLFILENGRYSWSLRCLYPIFVNGKIAGSVEAFYNIKDVILTPIEKIFNVKAALITRKPETEKKLFIQYETLSNKYIAIFSKQEDELIRDLKKLRKFDFDDFLITKSSAYFSIPIESIEKKNSAFLIIGIHYKRIENLFYSTFYKYASFEIIIILLGLLIYYISIKRSIISPLRKIDKNIKEISLTGNLKNKTLKVSSRDELGRAIETFNKLVLRTSELFEFKETIEEDSSTEDVFKRIEYLLKNKFGIKTYSIYLVKNSQDKMNIISSQKDKMWCSREILLNSSLCRAKRIGKIVDSKEDFPGICPYFRGGDLYHLCVPIYFQESVGAILQIVYKKEEADFIKKNKPLLLNYIKEAAPVLEAKQLMKSLKESVMRDPLTGIYNRRFLEEFEEHISGQADRDKIKFGVLMIDLDHFKRVNDRFGHDVGDFVLTEIVDVFHNTIRRLDMVFRYGGEEFLIILNNVKAKENAVKVAEKIRENVEKHEFKKMSIRIPQITISIGVSVFPDDSEDFWESVKKADIALYRAKETGRNKVIAFDSSMEEQKGD